MEELHLGYRRQRVSSISNEDSPAHSLLTTLHRHSFKLLPNIGKHVVELLEGNLAEDLTRAWRWRPGGDALKSRRAAPAKDLANMPGWNHDDPSTAKL